MSDDKWHEPLRARRIRDRDRLLNRAAGMAKAFYPQPVPGTDYSTWEGVFARRRTYGVHTADNRTLCSCAGCGNPRRWFGSLKRHEIRADDKARGFLDDVYGYEGSILREDD